MEGDKQPSNPAIDDDMEMKRELREMIGEVLASTYLRGAVLCMPSKEDLVGRIVCAMIAAGVGTDEPNMAWENAAYRRCQVMLASMIADSIRNESRRKWDTKD